VNPREFEREQNINQRYIYVLKSVISCFNTTLLYAKAKQARHTLNVAARDFPLVRRVEPFLGRFDDRIGQT
jgi:hypothetical protein